MPPNNWDIFQNQIRTLGESMAKNFDEVKGMLNAFDARVRSIETGEAGCQAIVASRLDAAWKKLDEHTSKLNDTEKIVNTQVLVVDKLIDSQKQLKEILRWILGVITTIFIAIFIALATGQAQVIFK
jgi:hypoxanthine-guanine phosphoribosyltransferase